MEELQFVGPGNVTLPDADRGTLTGIPAGIVWNMTGAATVGAFQVQLEGRTVSAVLAAIPGEESDLRSLPESVFADRLSGGRTLNYTTGRIAGKETQDDLWVWLAVACVGCVVLELLTLRLFRT